MKKFFSYKLYNKKSVVQKYKYLIVFSIVSFFLFSGCADIVKEKSQKACNDALNKGDYDTAIDKCSKRADLAAAYAGKGGFDIGNILEGASNDVNAYTDTTDDGDLGTDSNSSATILNILNLTPDKIENIESRAKAIENAQGYLEDAIDLLAPVDANDLTGDEIMLEIFTTAFAMELERVLLFDIGRPADTTMILLGKDPNLEVEEGLLVPYDGHTWTLEQNGSFLDNCSTIVSSIGNTSNTKPRGISVFMTQLVAAIAKLGSSFSGTDLTEMVTESQSEISTLLELVPDTCP